MSIRIRLLLIAILATLLPALLVLARFFQDRDAAVRADTQRLTALAQNVVLDLHDRIQGTAQLHFGLARARDLDTDDRTACSAFLAEVRETYPQYTGILTIRPDGRLFCDSLHSGRELDLNNRNYFRQALQARDVVLEPVFGRLTGLAVLQVAYPVRTPDGQLRFVLLASLNLAKLLTPEVLSVPDARVLIVDDKGTVLVSVPPDPGALAVGSTLAGTPLLRWLKAQRGPGTTDVPTASRQVYRWALADGGTVADAHLHVLAGAPRASLEAAANSRLRQDMAVLALAAAIVFVAVWLLAELALRKQVGRVTGMARRMAGGDLAARIEPPLPRGELGTLMAVMNEAAQSLQTQRNDIASLNSRLMQAQRLEAIGQLTGGVAHDFNNLLTVVLGNAEVLAEICADDPMRLQLAQMIGSAAQRGAELTRQLLAFTRKQALAPSAVDVNQLLAGLDPLLRRTLGEHIEIEMVRAAGLWPAMVDPGQLENALLNLCLNARDAMPRGGRLTLETANTALDDGYIKDLPDLVPGQYVMLAVSDTGSGIPAEHLHRVFEPFFTTKEKGKGTGLGLAMVYGFAKQSAGHVSIYSEAGQGTTVRLYLPRASQRPVAAAASAPAPAVATHGRGETILVVEDDALVRRYACSELQALGYVVFEAASGSEAMGVLEREPSVQLLFTDVVMPGGMSGRDLAEAAAQRWPALRVLYTSGYTQNAIVHHGRLDPGVQLLAKPYHRAELARAVRVALGGETPG